MIVSNDCIYPVICTLAMTLVSVRCQAVVYVMPIVGADSVCVKGVNCR